MEIERKFLIKNLPDNLEEYNYHLIEQAYICTNPVVRIRRQDDDFILTYKGGGMMTREEYNLPLGEYGYYHMLKKADGIVISKKRYLIPYGKYTIELDIFEKDLAPLIMAEVEFESEDEAYAFVGPDWFGQDVTRDGRYHNSYMSKYGYSE